MKPVRYLVARERLVLHVVADLKLSRAAAAKLLGVSASRVSQLYIVASRKYQLGARKLKPAPPVYPKLSEEELLQLVSSVQYKGYLLPWLRKMIVNFRAGKSTTTVAHILWRRGVRAPYVDPFSRWRSTEHEQFAALRAMVSAVREKNLEAAGVFKLTWVPRTIPLVTVVEEQVWTPEKQYAEFLVVRGES